MNICQINIQLQTFFHQAVGALFERLVALAVSRFNKMFKLHNKLHFIPTFMALHDHILIYLYALSSTTNSWTQTLHFSQNSLLTVSVSFQTTPISQWFTIIDVYFLPTQHPLRIPWSSTLHHLYSTKEAEEATSTGTACLEVEHITYPPTSLVETNLTWSRLMTWGGISSTFLQRGIAKNWKQ